MSVQCLCGGVSHGLGGVGDETEPSVLPGIVGENNAIRHVAVSLEQGSEFFCANVPWKATDEQSGAWGCTGRAAATAAALAFESEVGAFSSVFPHVGGNERRPSSGTFGKHGFSSSTPTLSCVVESAGALVKFSPPCAVIVGKCTVRLMAAGWTQHVPIPVLVRLQAVST